MLQSMMARLARIIVRYPLRICIVFFLVTAACGYLATHIQIKSSFSHLLPDNAQSVIDLKNISTRMGGMGTLIVQIEGTNLKEMERLADTLATRLKAYPKDEVLFVDYKVDAPKAFFEKNKYLFLSVDELKKLRDDVDSYIKDRKKKANPFYIDLGDDSDGQKKPDKLDFESTKEKYASYLNRFDRYKDGYLTNEAGDTLIIVIKTPGEATGVDFAVAFCAKVEAEIASINPSSFKGVTAATLTGDLKTLPEEYEALRDDILIVSNLAIVLVLISVSFYFRSFRLTTILSIGLVSAVITTFGIVYLHIGYLTAATAFLSSIVSGNGINFGIYFLARYLEERRINRDLESVISTTLTRTVLAVSIAALASGASYASLMATQFKGFSHFGFIGGVGMVICLFFALTFVPALAVLWERWRPFVPAPLADHGAAQPVAGLSKWIHRVFFSQWVTRSAAWFVERHPRPIAVLSIATLIAAIVSIVLFMDDPYEYNFRKLRNQTSETSGSGHRSKAAEKILGERSSFHVVLADRIDQVPAIKEKLMAYHVSNPDPEKRAIRSVKTIFDYIPGSTEEQVEKIAILDDIRSILSRNMKLVEEKRRAEIEENLPAEGLAVITADTIPEELTRPYTELNGTRGTLLLVDQYGSVWQKEPIERFSRAVREIHLDNNEIIRSSGTVVIFNDIIAFLAAEGPRAVLSAFVAVMILLIIIFRNVRHVLIVGSAMTVSVIYMLGLGVALDQKLNFLNFIAIPIQFGIGVDYSVNVYMRYLEEGPGSIGRVLRSTGGAVMICSLTTIIGYGAMWFSMNGAINSLATLANIGELCAIATASLVMPAFIVIFCKGKEVITATAGK